VELFRSVLSKARTAGPRQTAGTASVAAGVAGFERRDGAGERGVAFVVRDGLVVLIDESAEDFIEFLDNAGTVLLRRRVVALSSG